MGKTKCLGCGKSLGGVLDGFGSNVLYGQVCLSCKKKVQNMPNYQAFTADQMRAAVNGEAVFTAPAQAPVNYMVQAQTPAPDEELRKYKQLLDEGLITSEEFEVLKKRVLNL